MLEQITAAHFLPLLHQPFALSLTTEPVTTDTEREAYLPVELIAVLPSHSRPAQTIFAHGRELYIRPDPFSLEFLGPRLPALDQGSYWLHHPNLPLDEPLFFVPLSESADGRIYEVVFG
jgi:hypothetical protein